MKSTLKSFSLAALTATLSILVMPIGLPAKADLLRIIENQNRQRVNNMVECQKRGLTAQYEGDSGTEGMYFRIEGDRVLRAVTCDSGGVRSGVERWEQAGRLNEVVSVKCDYSGSVDRQWAIQQGKLVLIERVQNCLQKYAGRWEDTLYIKGTARPIKWYCYKFVGYNPYNLAQNCDYNRVSTSSSGSSPGGGSGSSVQNFFKGLFSR